MPSTTVLKVRFNRGQVRRINRRIEKVSARNRIAAQFGQALERVPQFAGRYGEFLARAFGQIVKHVAA